MFKFYELISFIKVKDVLTNDIRAYFMKEFMQYKMKDYKPNIK